MEASDGDKSVGDNTRGIPAIENVYTLSAGHHYGMKKSQYLRLSMLHSWSSFCFSIVCSLKFLSLLIQCDLITIGPFLQGGLTILLINLSNSTVNVAVNLLSHPKDVPMSHGNKISKHQLIPKKFKVSKLSVTRWEYHLSAPYDDLHSQTVLLNGVPLEITLSGELPSLDPIVKENSSPVSVAPLSIVFVVLPDAQVSICAIQQSQWYWLRILSALNRSHGFIPFFVNFLIFDLIVQ